MDQGIADSPFRALATGLPQLVFGCRADGNRTWPSPQWVVYTGLSAEKSLGFGWLDAIHPDDRLATLDAWERASDTGNYLVLHRIQRVPDGAFIWHQTRAARLPEPMPGGLEWVGSSADVDDMQLLREAVARAEEQLRVLVEGLPQLLWRSCDLGHWTWASPQWLSFTGQSQEESLQRGWLDAVHPDDHARTLEAWERARPTGILDVDFRVRRVADGAYLWHRTRSNPVHDAAGRIVEWLGSTTDVEELKALQHRQLHLLDELAQHARALEAKVAERERAEARLLYDARHDGLTGLFNRTYLMDRLRLALERRAPCAVLLLDLDRFKLVNDSLGHQTGDVLLEEMARRLQACVGLHDTLARFGGDEFVLLMEDDPGGAVLAAERIVAATHRPLWLGEQEVFPSCSVGVVHTTAAHESPEAVLRDADIAMYDAKRRRNGGYAVFDAAMHDQAVEALRLRTDLRHALSRGELLLHYQPICAAGTGRVAGLEALVRWRHERRGTVPPAAFIPVAEEIGLISEIGRWVLRTACAQLRAWRERFPGLALRISVNTSAEELKDANFTPGIRDALAEAGLEPGALQLEVTESIFLQHPDRVGAILDGIRALGVRIALDDFGTGYSSLAYLDRYRLDTIKIDQSFVAGLPGRGRSAAIVETMVRLGEAIGLEVVAEGVEDEAQFRSLREAGCGFVQGYLLGRPAPAADITLLLEGQAAAVLA